MSITSSAIISTFSYFASSLMNEANKFTSGLNVSSHPASEPVNNTGKTLGSDIPSTDRDENIYNRACTLAKKVKVYLRPVAIGALVGAVVGTLCIPIVGSYIGTAAGAVIGHKYATDYDIPKFEQEEKLRKSNVNTTNNVNTNNVNTNNDIHSRDGRVDQPSLKKNDSKADTKVPNKPGLYNKPYDWLVIAEAEAELNKNT